jgi:hypothetical protein
MIAQIIAALAVLVSQWKPTDSITNDIADGIAVLAAIETVDPGLALAGGVLQTLTKIEASYANLVNDQAALVGTVAADFDGQADKVVVLALRESSPLAKQLLGL